MSDAPNTPQRGPVVIDLEDESIPDVAAAPEIEDHPPEGLAMQAAVARMAQGKRRGLGPWFLGLAGSLLSLALGVAAWDFAASLVARVPVLGWLAVGLSALLVVVLAIMAARELWGYRRLNRLGKLRTRAEQALNASDLTEARAVVADLARLYGTKGQDDALDADAMLEVAEARMIIPLDTRALAEVETSARQVALATALVPLALADVLAALTINLRMIRRVAEIYGGQPGTLSNWRLARAVALHLTATGMVAVGDDLIGSLAGGGVMSKISRRFGEGAINGALTVRVGLAAMDLCRPLPYRLAKRPSVSATAASALRGLFPRS